MRKETTQLRKLFAWTLLVATAATAVPSIASTTYTYTGGPYTDFIDNCTTPVDPHAGPCSTYTDTMNAHGSFTLSSPLPPNFGPTDISTRSDLVWSFSDGINTYSSTDTAHALVEPGSFKVQTDAAGVPIFSGTVIALDLWQTVPGDNKYIDFLDIGYRPYSPPVGDYANTGWICLVQGSFPGCNTDNYGANISNVASSVAGTWAVTGERFVAPLPAMGLWGMLVLVCGVVGVGLRARHFYRLVKPN